MSPLRRPDQRSHERQQGRWWRAALCGGGAWWCSPVFWQVAAPPRGWCWYARRRGAGWPGSRRVLSASRRAVARRLACDDRRETRARERAGGRTAGSHSSLRASARAAAPFVLILLMRTMPGFCAIGAFILVLGRPRAVLAKGNDPCKNNGPCGNHGSCYGTGQCSCSCGFCCMMSG